MTSYAAFARAGRAPILVPDRFSVWAFVFGPFWLLAHAAWIPAVLLFAMEIVLRVLVHGPAMGAIGLGIAWLVGLHGHDLRGWSLTRRGWRLATVVVAPRGADDAYARLLTSNPELREAAAA